MITFIYNKGLSKELLTGIENRSYSPEELISIHTQLKNRYANKKTGMTRALAMVAVCAVVVMAMGLMGSSADPTSSIVMIIVLIALIAAAMFFVKKNFVDKAKNQFIKAVKKGYPDMAERLGESSFR